MIDRLRIGTTANFFRVKRRLTALSISELFRQLRATTRSPSRNLFRHVRQKTNGVTWSAISFFQDRDPVFLRPPPIDQSERTCGYLLLIEHRQHLAVFKTGLELTSGFKTRHLDRIGHDGVDRTHRLVRKEGDDWLEISQAETEPIMAALDGPLPIRVVRNEWRIMETDEVSRVGTLRLNASRISLRAFERAALQGVFVERTECPVGADPDRLALRNFIDHNDHFLVLFDNVSLAYLFGTLYRDDAFAAGDETLLRYLRPDARLALATDEKGTFTAVQTRFDQDSIFGIVVDGIARDDNTLVCDDLGDEWADFIGLNDRGNVPVRPRHHAQAAGAIENFKKTSPRVWTQSRARRRSIATR